MSRQRWVLAVAGAGAFALFAVTSLAGAAQQADLHVAAGNTAKIVCDGNALSVNPVDAKTVNVSCAGTTTTTAQPTTTTAGPTTTVAPPPVPPTTSAGIFTSPAEIATLPTTGAAWANVKAAADALVPSSATLSNQDSKTGAQTLAAAMVGVRLNDATYKSKATDALKAVIGTEAGGRTLSMGRTLPGYIFAANLLGYSDPTFVSWLRTLPDKVMESREWDTLRHTAAKSANNWGARAQLAMLAYNLYVGDSAGLAESVRIYKSYVREPGVASTFTSPTTADIASWECVSGTHIGMDENCEVGKNGAIPSDVSRDGAFYPTVGSSGAMYTWSASEGTLGVAYVLRRNGYPDVLSWGADAWTRAINFDITNGFFPPQYAVSYPVADLMQRLTHVDAGFHPSSSGVAAEYLGFDWLGVS